MLTDEQAAHITMVMRVVNHLQSNMHIIQKDKAVLDELSNIKEALRQIFAELSEEERDGLLEQYKTEAEFLGLYNGPAA